jgi:hypothetical protein
MTSGPPQRWLAVSAGRRPPGRARGRNVGGRPHCHLANRGSVDYRLSIIGYGVNSPLVRYPYFRG